MQYQICKRNMHNMHLGLMKYICIISVNMLKYAKNICMYAKKNHV